MKDIENRSDGWIFWHRKVIDKHYDAETYMIWSYLVLLANHKTTYVRQIKIERGQHLTGRKKLSEMTGINESKVERVLKLLESEQQIEQQITRKYRIITIKNYEEYQKVNNKVNNTQQQTHLKRTTKNTNNNDKNDNNEKNDNKIDTPANAADCLSPQALFVENWSQLYKEISGQEYKADRKDYILVANLLKKYGEEVVTAKTRLLFNSCNGGRGLWFAKGMGDFTIGKLSAKWNEIIEGGEGNGKCPVSKSEIEEFLRERE